ncbi:MAG: hypothetical protein BWY78_00420 [Alphaproteobacteria bacterium ADurb.Bin438]|nr:MAG: hypothetical protein BWY78_00420 [Alphaproteobacteria bacterium ADurb.Bin438]
MKRYNFKLIEKKHCEIDVLNMPDINSSFNQRNLALYGIDANRYAYFEGIDNPMVGLKFLNKIWNLEVKEIEIAEDFEKSVEYYLNKQKFHNVIALIRTVIKNEKALPRKLVKTLSLITPYICAEIMSNEQNI